MSHPPLAFCEHDHDACAEDVLQTVETLCTARGLRLTPVRRRTLEILLEAHQAMGAYEVLERLAADGFGDKPPVAYRALDFLVSEGLAHRIDRLNAFCACMHPGETHRPAFLICEGCEKVSEMRSAAIGAAIDTAARVAGFSLRRTSIEATGLCAACQDTE